MSSAFHIIASSRCQLGLERAANHDSGENAPEIQLGNEQAAKHEKKEIRLLPVRYFFHAIYQKQPAIYRSTHETYRISETRHNCPLLRAFSMDWDDVAALLRHCHHEHTTTGTSPPLIFQNGIAITDPYTLYASNPHAAYLDGCSIIINHADLHHPIIAQLCNNLQQTFRKLIHFDVVDLIVLAALSHTHVSFWIDSACLCKCLPNARLLACSRGPC
jgi:hypothetical protein